MMLESVLTAMSEKNDFGEQMPGTIGRYQVQNSIGYGAMGAVYKAFDPLIKRTLAIKTIRLDIPRQSPQYKSFIERFYHEARISGTLSHPNIVTLFDIGEEGGVPYLAMEFVEGETISSIIDRGVKFPPEKVIALVSQVASAVDYAHGKGVIHRDIKPSNLILFDEERVKVTDFGIAKLVDSEMTQSGTLLGTPSYMSPEQAMGEKLDGRTDIFSLGVCAFEMLSGEQPFPGANVTSILYKLVHVDPIEPASLEMNGLVPQKWHDVFGKVLAKKPDERYQTAGAFVQDLEYCLGSWFGSAVGEETMLDAGGPATVVMSQPTLRQTPPVAPAPAAASPTQGSASAQKVPARMEEDVTAAMPGLKLPPAPPPSSPAATGKTVVAAKTIAPPAQVETPDEDAGFAPTVVMKAPTAEEPPPTVRAQALPSPPLPPPPQAPPPPAPPKATKEKTPPPAPAPKAAPLPPAPAAKATIPPTPKAPTARPSDSARKGPPLALILGGVGLVAVLVLVAGGLVLLKLRGGASTAASPSPVTEASVAPSPEAPTAEPTQTGTLAIETLPAGASITVNGEAKGVSPLQLPNLPVGNYEVRAELKGYEQKSSTATLTAVALQGSVKLVLSPLAPVMGVAQISSTPPGAAVSIDGTPGGQTPLASVKLRPGTHKVVITKDGYEAWSGSVSVDTTKVARIDASLAIIPPKVTAPPKPEVDPNRIYENTAADVDVLAKRVSSVTAEYPRKGVPSLRSGQSVSVSVSFVVTDRGEVDDVKVIESAGKVVDEAVVSAVRQWKYSPAEKLGQKVKVRVNFKQTFLAG